MPLNRRPPAESDESAASVFAPFQPNVPADAKLSDYKDKPLPGDEPPASRQRIGELSTKEIQEAAERDEPPAEVPERPPSISSLTAATVRDQYEPAKMQGLRDLTPAKPETKPTKPPAEKASAEKAPTKAPAEKAPTKTSAEKAPAAKTAPKKTGT